MRKICFLLVFLLVGLSEAKIFKDNNDFLWASSIIDKWSDRGIITGYIDGSFKGNNKLTRAEMITIINKLNNSFESLNKVPARDVYQNAWYYEDMGIALKNGIIDLDDNYNLRPNDFATREETFVTIARLFKLKFNGDILELLSKKFSDYYMIDGENLPYIAALVDENYVGGYEDNTLKPKSTITRAELIAIIDKMASEIYNSGNYANKTVNGNIIINVPNVSISNSEILGTIFVMDGAKEKVPILKNVDVTKGVISRIGNIYIEKSDTYNPIEEENKKNDPVFVKVTYSDENWTNDSVTATIKFDDDYEIINNSGSKRYKFTSNGEFVFTARGSEGNIVDFKVKVNNIDKIKPEFETIVSKQSGKATINIIVKDDDLSPTDGIYYLKGTDSSYRVVRYGKEVYNNIFDITEGGKYTIAVQDEAGNISRKIINITLESETVSGV